MINPSPIILLPAAHRLWLMFESTYTSALAKQVRSPVDPLADFCAAPRLPFLP